VAGFFRRTTSHRRGYLLAVVLLTTTTLVMVVRTGAGADPTNPDGGYSSLQSQLDQAVRAYNDAKGRLDVAQQRQADLAGQAKQTEAQLAELTVQANAVVTTVYKGGRLTGLMALLDDSTPGDFLSRATTLQEQISRDDRTLRELTETQSRYAEQLAAIDTEIRNQQVQLAAMDKRKTDIEKALASAGSRPSSGFGGGSASATPAPRNPDGSWPRESCSVQDPTTSGCLTPRTLHALQEARSAGFTHYTACWRSGTWGEHPLGRACDFAANPTGFVDAPATGADKAYGDRLAAWLLANASRLAVLYVIWYRQIWLPSSGWRTYHGDGTPAGDHVNHVHLSVQ
jgi:peptidoglycan DL-endopeptidase CwlO